MRSQWKTTVGGLLVICIVILGTTRANASVFTDSLQNGINTSVWAVAGATLTPTAAGWACAPSGVNFTDSGVLDLLTPITGDFQTQVGFSSLSLPVTDNNIVIYVVFADGTSAYNQIWNAGGPVDTRLWDGTQYGVTSTSATSGTLLFSRTGSTLSAYLNGVLTAQVGGFAANLTGVGFYLRTQVEGGSPTATFSNFQLSSASAFQVPEPALSLLLCSPLVLLLRRRRLA